MSKALLVHLFLKVPHLQFVRAANFEGLKNLIQFILVKRALLRHANHFTHNFTEIQSENSSHRKLAVLMTVQKKFVFQIFGI